MGADVDVIIPAYNEAATVALVVRAARLAPCVGTVLVVDDGSTDRTTELAHEAGARVLTLRPNRRKGGAMRAGLDATHASVVAFLDADLIGLQPRHVCAIAEPVLRGEAGQAVGLRDYGALWNRVQVGLPIITGERAVRRDLLARVPAEFWHGFRVETGINAAVRAAGQATVATVFDGVKIRTKWQKTGTRQGADEFGRMAVEVLNALRDARRTRF